jgi:hypothetical protein
VGGWARPIRMESEGGVYHVLNRGNYRLTFFVGKKPSRPFWIVWPKRARRPGGGYMRGA